MNKSIVLILSVAFLASVFAADVTIYGAFAGQDALAATQTVTIAAGATLSSVSFTALPNDPTVYISYPGSGSSSSIGSISNGASGYGYFQSIANSGSYYIIIVVKYKKVNTWYSYNSTILLTVEGGDSTTYGKKAITPKDEEVVVQSNTLGNADFAIEPYEGWYMEDAVTTWQTIRIISNGPALTSVTYTISSVDAAITVYYNERTGNSIGNIAANAEGYSYFQMNGNAGTHQVSVRINYRKSGVAKSYTETMFVTVGGGDNTTFGKRAIQSKIASVLPAEMSNLTVIGLAFAGIALIAIVAVVVVIAVVKRQRATIVA